MQGNFSLWTQKTFNYGPAENGWLFAYIGILAVLVQLRVLPFLTKNSVKNNSFIFLYFLCSLVYLSFHFRLNANSLVCCFIFFLPLGNGLANPTIQALAFENVPHEEYGGNTRNPSIGR